MKRHIILFAVIACGILIGTSTLALAQESSMRGTFTLNVRASNLAQWPDVWPDLKPKQRKQAEALSFVFQKIEFVKEKIVSSNLRGGGSSVLRSPLSTGQMQWTFKQQVFDLSTEWENGVMKRTFQAEDGQRVETYTLNADGSVLTVTVGISMPTLQKQVVHTLVYNEV